MSVDKIMAQHYGTLFLVLKQVDQIIVFEELILSAKMACLGVVFLD